MPPPLRVTLYGRPGCSLCDHAEQMLARIGRRIPMAVELVNIESDDALHERYMFEIPVITVDGAEVAKAPIYETALEEALAGLARR
ncbi:MAG: glutaredoxin family protein [Dehalococcoidia bacterium]|nr:glutaredoxin family protein [Dehalococcoidia bacterium]